MHFHGLLIPSDMDGSEEEGTLAVPPHGNRSYKFTPTPAGTRWYHTHTMSMDDLHRGSYTGMFGFLIIDGANNPGNYDQEHYLALRDWEPYFTNTLMDNDDLDHDRSLQPERPAVMDTRPAGPEVASDIFSINDKAAGRGASRSRVKQGDRVMFHFLNASAIEIVPPSGPAGPQVHGDGPGWQSRAHARGGRCVDAGAWRAHRCLGRDEIHPGVWIMGAPEDMVREAGLGIVIEYANQKRTPQWVAAPKSSWDYTIFGKGPSGPAPTEKLDMVFEKVPKGAGKFNSFTVNGKQYPHEQEFVLKQGTRYRLTFHNRTDDSHPLHLHRHQLEIAEIYGKSTAGVIKDTVVVPTYGRASVDFTADQAGTNAVSLSYSTAHGLRLQGAAAVRLNPILTIFHLRYNLIVHGRRGG